MSYEMVPRGLLIVVGRETWFLFVIPRKVDSTNTNNVRISRLHKLLT